MTFDYYYGSEADQFSFFRIPKRLVLNADFAPLSLPAKLLYSLLLDRMALSSKNGWLDGEGRVYIIYQVGEIQEDLGITKKKAIDLLSELEGFGLLEKKRRGHGLPNILYVKSFLLNQENSRGTSSRTSRSDIDKVRSTGNGTSEAILSSKVNGGNMVSYSGQNKKMQETGFQEVLKPAPPEVSEPELQEVPESAPLSINTYMNHTYLNNTESNPISSAMGCDPSSEESIEAKRQTIQENIGYRYLLMNHSDEKKAIDGILDLIVETVLSESEYTVIASSRIPTAVVRGRFLKLSMSHIEYILDCLKTNNTKVRNIKKYLLAALFNAPSTMDAYYQAEVNHDTMKYAAGRAAKPGSL